MTYSPLNPADLRLLNHVSPLYRRDVFVAMALTDTSGFKVGGGVAAGLIPEGVPRVAVKLAMEITGPFSVSGGATAGYHLTGAVFLGATPVYADTVSLAFTPGPIKADLTPIGNFGGTFLLEAQKGTTPEQRRDSDGYRPSTPVLVYAIDVAALADISPDDFNVPIQSGDTYPATGGEAVPIEGAFLVGDAALPDGGPKAVPHAIGFKSIGGQGGSTWVFRKPRKWEVVWYVELQDTTVTLPTADGDEAYPTTVDRGLYRFDGLGWKPYRSGPERSVAGMEVFDVFDPDRVVEYFARIVGATQSQTSLDILSLLLAMEAATAPDRLLRHIAASFGISVSVDDDPNVIRERLGTAIPDVHAKGLPERASLRLERLGYRGSVQEVWVDPEDAGNFDAIDDAPADVYDAGAGTGDAADRGIVDRISRFSGEKGTDILVKPAGTRAASPYVMSSRLVALVNHLDGRPVRLGDIGTANLDAWRENLARELRLSVLPIHADIRHFATAAYAGTERSDVSEVFGVQYDYAVRGTVYSGFFAQGNGSGV